jgi:hypothetical protein
MNTTALWIVAGIFGSIAVVLSQMNYLKLSIAFGIPSIPFLILALFALRKEKNPDHRPKLILRHVTIKPHSHPSNPIECGKPVQVEWTVVNIGDENAIIVKSNATVQLLPQPFPARTPFSKDRDTMGTFEFLPGDDGVRTYTMLSDLKFQNEGTKFQKLKYETNAIYFFGFIKYKDPTGSCKRTAFCRRYDIKAERFVIVDDPDYEYSD